MLDSFIIAQRWGGESNRNSDGERIGVAVIVMTSGGLRVRRKTRLGQACYQR